MSIGAIAGGISSIFGLLQQLGGSGQTTSSAAATDADPPVKVPKHHGHRRISSQLQDALTTALNNAPPTADPNQVIQTTIQNFLKNPPAATTSTAAQQDASQQNFEAALQAKNVTPQQFQQDLKDVVSQAQGTGEDPSVLFKNVAPGSLVDTTG